MKNVFSDNYAFKAGDGIQIDYMTQRTTKCLWLSIPIWLLPTVYRGMRPRITYLEVLYQVVNQEVH